MNAGQKELFRKAILAVLAANRTRFGIGIVNLGFRLAMFGFNAGDFGGNAEAMHDAIADALDYLQHKGLIEEVNKQVSAENRAWRITTGGIAFVDSGA